MPGGDVVCSREEWSGDLSKDEKLSGFVHVPVSADCGCGEQHFADPAARPKPRAKGGRAKRRRRPAAKTGKTPKIVATYRYLDETGALLWEVCRRENKAFIQRRPNGRGGWTYNANGVRRVLYRLPGVLAAGPDATIFLSEGEKDVDALTDLGAAATCNPGGAGKWSPDFSAVLVKRQVVVIADADEAGRRHAQQVAVALHGKAAGIKVVELPGDGVKDAADWIAAGGTLRELELIAQNAPEWNPPKGLRKQSVNGWPAILARAMSGRYRFARDEGGDLYSYDRVGRGVYERDGERLVRGEVKRLLDQWTRGGAWTKSLGGEVVAYIRDGAPQLLDRPPLDLLNLRNGLLDIQTRTLYPHTPSYLSPVQLPVEFDAAAKCPEIDAFVAATFPADAHEVAWQTAALLMIPYTGIQKAILVKGPAGCGKSRWLNVLVRFIGPANVTAMDLQTMCRNEFALSNIRGRLAVVCADLPGTPLEDTSLFRRLVGGDMVSVDRKYAKRRFDIKPFARLVFSCNEPPQPRDAGQAYFDRWIVVPMERRFRGTAAEIPENVLDAKLTTPAELSGLLNRALDRVAQVQKKGIATPESVRLAAVEMRRQTDPLSMWIEQRVEFGPDFRVPWRAIYEAYCQDRTAREFVRPSAKGFGVAVREVLKAKGVGPAKKLVFERTVKGEPVKVLTRGFRGCRLWTGKARKAVSG